jgi:hypothetical protein
MRDPNPNKGPFGGSGLCLERRNQRSLLIRGANKRLQQLEILIGYQVPVTEVAV